jgi:hypothetical protein
MTFCLILASPDLGDTTLPRLKDLLLSETRLQSLKWLACYIGADRFSFTNEFINYRELLCLEDEGGSICECLVEGYDVCDGRFLEMECEQRTKDAVVTLQLIDGDTWVINARDSALIDNLRIAFSLYVRDW